MFYQFFDLVIKSDFILDLPIANHSNAEVEIQSAETLPDVQNSFFQIANESINQREVRFKISSGLEVYLCDGSQILIHHSDSNAFKDISRCILFYILPLLLTQRGWLVLHGSANHVHGKGVIFIGSSGSGKSTATALLNELNYPTLGDDLILLREIKGDVFIAPLQSHIALLPDSAEFINKRKITLTKRSDNKFLWHYHTKIPSSYIPLGYVFHLEQGNSEFQLNKLTPLEGTVSLLSNLWSPRVAQIASGSKHLEAVSLISYDYPIVKLKRKTDSLNAYSTKAFIDSVLSTVFQQSKTLEQLSHE